MHIPFENLLKISPFGISVISQDTNRYDQQTIIGALRVAQERDGMKPAGQLPKAEMRLELQGLDACCAPVKYRRDAIRFADPAECFSLCIKDDHVEVVTPQSVTNVPVNTKLGGKSQVYTGTVDGMKVRIVLKQTKGTITYWT